MANWAMIGAMVFPNIGGWAGGFISARNIPNWYENLKKPDWRPANWVFGPVWTSLYTSMGYASYLVWQDGGGFNGRAKYPLMLYGAQLALNWAWTPIFFGLHRLGTSVITIGLCYGAVVATAISFYEVNPTAGLIMIPYIAWMTLASTLNYIIWKDNKDNDKEE